MEASGQPLSTQKCRWNTTQQGCLLEISTTCWDARCAVRLLEVEASLTPDLLACALDSSGWVEIDPVRPAPGYCVDKSLRWRHWLRQSGVQILAAGIEVKCDVRWSKKTLSVAVEWGLHGAFFGFSGVFWGHGNRGMPLGNWGGEARGKLWVKKAWRAPRTKRPAKPIHIRPSIVMFGLWASGCLPASDSAPADDCNRDDDGARLGTIAAENHGISELSRFVVNTDWRGKREEDIPT
ncbi:hypothetical protein GE21DRAFT_1340014 [Neurospora crassa]|nr:hypothetical protein GE21DRAFT_1340014 [Neurospora crassa]